MADRGHVRFSAFSLLLGLKPLKLKKFLSDLLRHVTDIDSVGRFAEVDLLLNLDCEILTLHGAKNVFTVIVTCVRRFQFVD